MADRSGTLVAALYASEDRAQVVLDMIQQMSRVENIRIHDAAVLVKDLEGRIHVRETRELTAKKGARRGAAITGLVSLFFPAGLIASAVAGGIGGAIAGKLRDTGIRNDAIADIAGRIDTGKAAVVVLAESESVARVEQALTGYESDLIVQPVDAETMAHVQATGTDSTDAPA